MSNKLKLLYIIESTEESVILYMHHLPIVGFVGLDQGEQGKGGPK